MKKHIVILGPPAVGKRTIGNALSLSLFSPVFDNAKTVDLAVLAYGYGGDEFREYRDFLRMDFYDRFLRSARYNYLISTNVLRHKENWSYFESVEQKFLEFGWSTIYILLTANVASLLCRAQSSSRQNKLSIRTAEEMINWLSCNPFHSDLHGRQALCLDTSTLSVDDSVEKILMYLKTSVCSKG